ncbi:MAG: hypothetical protein U0X20_22100 [Caldilineaceae bacterium]
MGKAKRPTAGDQVERAAAESLPRTTPEGPGGLWVSDAQATDPGVLWAGLDRAELRRRHAVGDLPELEFDAVVFRATYPNWNYVRFRPEELAAFAASFVGAPFLRNHNLQDIAARDGIVTACSMQGDAMHARVKLTTEEGIRDFLAGRIDRFSISWFKRGPTICSVCGCDWLGAECEHVPGRAYAVSRESGAQAAGNRAVTCELVQVDPVGREVSAVNVPASSGTGLMSEQLEQWIAFKERNRMSGAANEEIVQVEAQDAAAGGTDALAAELAGLRDEVLGEVASIREARDRLQLDAALAASGLPAESQAVIRRVAEPLLGCLDLAQVQELIGLQRSAVAAAVQPAVVTGMRPITARELRTGADDLQEALDWCLGVQGGRVPPPSLRNIRDVYLAITGDVDFYGVFNPEHAQLAAASTTTLPGLAKNALNKVIRQHYDNLATFRWYERIVDVVPHDGSTQDIDLVMVDGLANLPTVAEGAAYTEAVTGDSAATMSFGKRGVYVGITLEMFRRSDIARMQAIPRELVKAAIRTRSAAIAGIFTAGSGAGPTLADDSTALFHANHGNLATVAFSTTEWAAARKRIFSQTVPGTGSKLGLWPTFCLLPVDLYDTALEAFGYGAGDVGKPNSGGTAQTVNPYGESRMGDPRPIPVVVPEWTDATDWAQIVDPRLHPVIQMAYANAPQGGLHALPEIYEVRSETAGLMFTNDTLPIKIRDWWAYGVATYVGVGKNNVAA